MIYVLDAALRLIGMHGSLNLWFLDMDTSVYDCSFGNRGYGYGLGYPYMRFQKNKK